MPLERTLQVISLPAAADLSACQFRGVSIDSDGRVAKGSGSVSKTIGVLQNKPSGTSDAAEVAIGGVSRMVAGGSIASGDWVKVDANGLGLTTATSGNSVIGKAVSNEGSASGNIFEVLIIPVAIP